jgi:hypothetical protein
VAIAAAFAGFCLMLRFDRFGAIDVASMVKQWWQLELQKEKLA